MAKGSVRKRKPSSARTLFQTPSRYLQMKRARTSGSVKRERVTTIIKSPGPIPPRAIVKMKYSEIIAVNGVAMDHMFNLNSTFDPNLSGVGHQPYGRDTYITLYNRYRVLACAYNITWMSAGASGYGMLGWDNSTSSRTNYSLWQETPKSRVCSWTTTTPGRLKGNLVLRNITGVTAAEYKDDRFQATSGTDPSENIILHVGFTDQTGNVVTASQLYVKVTLVYTVEWFDQLTLGQS